MSALVVRGDIVRAARNCGARLGDTLLVHASLSALGHVVGGAESLILGLLDVVGPSGTLAAPTQSWRNLDPATGVHDRPEDEWPAIRAAIPGYDPATSPGDRMGRVAEALRTWPGARRSPHPARSWSAIGAGAEILTARHELHDMHGEASPLGAAMARDALVLMVGTGYGSCTALHLAETRAAGRAEGRARQTCWIRTPAGRRGVEIDAPTYRSDDFEEIGRAFEASHGIVPVPLGDGVLRPARIRALVPFAARAMEA